MAFHVQFREQDETYLAERPGVSATGIDKYYQRIDSDVGDSTQAFRDERRLHAGSPYFEYGVVLADAGRVHHFRTYVDDSRAAFGVLRVVYIEHTPGLQLPSP